MPGVSSDAPRRVNVRESELIDVEASGSFAEFIPLKQEDVCGLMPTGGMSPISEAPPSVGAYEVIEIYESEEEDGIRSPSITPVEWRENALIPRQLISPPKFTKQIEQYFGPSEGGVPNKCVALGYLVYQNRPLPMVSIRDYYPSTNTAGAGVRLFIPQFLTFVNIKSFNFIRSALQGGDAGMSLNGKIYLGGCMQARILHFNDDLLDTVDIDLRVTRGSHIEADPSEVSMWLERSEWIGLLYNCTHIYEAILGLGGVADVIVDSSHNLEWFHSF